MLTQKVVDFILFKQIVEIINKKSHLSFEGFQKIINIKASMNLGLSEVLKTEFGEVIPVQRPIINIKQILDPYWLAGFVTGEGCFFNYYF